MSSLTVLWVLSTLVIVAAGLAISWVAVRWLRLNGRNKASLFALLFVVFFTPILVPAGTIAALVLPMLGAGLIIFWWHPINFASMAACLAIGALAGWWLFVRVPAIEVNGQHG